MTLTNRNGIVRALRASLGIVGLFVQVAGVIDQERSQLTDVLRRLTLHESSLPPDEIVMVIREAMQSADPDIREAGLAALVSRSAGPRFDRRPVVKEDWERDYGVMQALRPDVHGLLDDAFVKVRSQAVRTLLNLEWDPARGFLIRAETFDVLALAYDSESDGSVRGEIISGLAHGIDSTPLARNALERALRDRSVTVREWAMDGAHKLDSGFAMGELARLLGDEAPSVRMRAATKLASFGPAARAQIPLLEQALTKEADSSIRAAMERAIAVISKS